MHLEPVIGLEVHVQLATRSKLFCGCPNRFGGEPNERICPICLGYPGTLPTINAEAVEQAIRLSLALDADVRPTSVFARKNYFYPDLPKGYQISQFDQPLALGGRVPLADGSVLRLTRLHLEEDAGKLLHELPGGVALPGESLVDYNRCGVPLVEIVSEPDLRSAAQAQDALQRLHQVLGYTGTSDGNMEEGSLRCDANVSLRPRGSDTLGDKVEVKNLNSFRNVARAIEFEIERQTLVLEGGGRVAQETRSFDAGTGSTATLRSKEEAQDYRYFPEPDLAPLVLDPGRLETLRAEMPERPWERALRFGANHGLSAEDAHLLSSTRELADYFEAAVAQRPGSAQSIGNWIRTEVLRELKHHPRPSSEWIGADALAELVALIEEGELSASAAKDVFAETWASGERPAAVMARLGLVQVRDDGQLRAWVDRVLEENPGPARQLRDGEQKVVAFLIGQVMRLSSGSADPRLVREALLSHLPAADEAG